VLPVTTTNILIEILLILKSLHLNISSKERNIIYFENILANLIKISIQLFCLDSIKLIEFHNIIIEFTIIKTFSSYTCRNMSRSLGERQKTVVGSRFEFFQTFTSVFITL
jgi:hypothetical protein